MAWSNAGTETSMFCALQELFVCTQPATSTPATQCRAALGTQHDEHQREIRHNTCKDGCQLRDHGLYVQQLLFLCTLPYQEVEALAVLPYFCHWGLPSVALLYLLPLVELLCWAFQF